MFTEFFPISLHSSWVRPAWWNQNMLPFCSQCETLSLGCGRQRGVMNNEWFRKCVWMLGWLSVAVMHYSTSTSTQQSQTWEQRRNSSSTLKAGFTAIWHSWPPETQTHTHTLTSSIMNTKWKIWITESSTVAPKRYFCTNLVWSSKIKGSGIITDEDR